jgi:RNA polymerase sigma factor (sigma-70 family)
MADDLLPLVYAELRRLAARQLAGEAPGQTLQPTALVHEAYIRLMASRRGTQRSGVAQPGEPPGAHAPGSPDRSDFLAAAATAMRRILIDRARARRAEKRGGGRGRADLDPDQLAAPERSAELLALDEALTRLAAKDPRKAKLVELRYFAGLTLDEAAAAVGISPATADRDWAFARAWLHRELQGEPGA